MVVASVGLEAEVRWDFKLDLSEGFAYDCLHRETARLEMAEYRHWALEQFSGTLCVDELHLGRYMLLLATDPLGDFPVAFALVDANDQEHLRRFLNNLKTWGFSPEVVITDGSNLYPGVLAALWPNARHQLCIFHVIQDISGHVLDAIKRMRRELTRHGNRGRRRRRGRPQKSRKKKQGLTLKEKAYFNFKHRYLIVTRHENLSDIEQKQLAKVIHLLSPEKFEKMVAFLRSPAGKCVRTNNHVERQSQAALLRESPLQMASPQIDRPLPAAVAHKMAPRAPQS